jgi:TolB protein
MMRRVALVVGVCLLGNIAGFAQIGIFDAEVGVGNPQKAGKAVFDSDKQEYTITGAGNNMYHNTDQCHFVYKKMVGDFVIRARCKGYILNGAEPNENCKAGWLARKSLATGSIYAGTGLHQKGLATLLYRGKESGETGEVKDLTKITNTTPNITQFQRKGNTYIMGLAIEGQTMHYDTLDTLPRPIDGDLACMDRPVRLGDDTIYVGLFVCSKNANALETFVFDSVYIGAGEPTPIAARSSALIASPNISIQSLFNNPELFSSITIMNSVGQRILAGDPARFSGAMKSRGPGVYFVQARTLNGSTHTLKVVNR